MQNKGTVYFFTGLSGAGKTTIGKLFYDRLKASKPNVVMLDGDEIRPVFCEDSGYSHEDRLKRARRIFRTCKFLADQEIDVICCSIAMYSEIREWNRKNIENYREIYIKVTRETLIRRDQKGLYSSGKNVVGIDLPFDEPSHPDVVLENNGDEAPPVLAERLAELFLPQAKLDPVDCTAYWDQYYKNKLCTAEPSAFARFVSTLIEKTGKMIELGCGNGRDAVYFAQLGLDIIACDRSSEVISGLSARNIPNAEFLCADLLDDTLHPNDGYDYEYSRFTLHAIDEEQEKKLFANVFRSLKKGGKFFIESRSVNDPSFGKGEKVGRNSFYYDFHYRRFIVLSELTETLIGYGFRIEYAEEKTGFAPYGSDDPPIIRVIAVKP